MKTRTKYVIAIVALLPLGLMADGVITDRVAKSNSETPESKEFQMIELVPRKSAGHGSSYYTAPPQPY